jgi:hypothetical protein
MNIEHLQNGTIVTTQQILSRHYTPQLIAIKMKKSSIESNIKQTWATQTMNMSKSIWRLAKHIVILKHCKTHNDCEQSQIEAYNDLEQNQIQELQDKRQLWTK